ncbi:MAG: 3-oxoacyl-[acyl-carrier-protein] reductase FabG [Frankiales bacterium]|jgi:2-hydroxycyclohexanecarboxyl-CoA dehydrogenase|nr:3-oxoacyl-[acyl-carrier-protein] reductase FabG [Frankiales bacterium]
MSETLARQSPVGVPAFGLDTARVVIAGGTSGVGLHTAQTLALAGAPSIVLIGRDVDRGRAAVEQVRRRCPDVAVSFLSADINDPRQAERVTAEALEELGGVDVLVNSTVASYSPVLLHKIPLDEVHDILVRQAVGCLLLSRAMIDTMRDQGSGSIINIASDAAKVPTPGETVLGAAMAAIVTFSRTLALEAKRYGVRVNVLTPSLIVNTGSYDRSMNAEFSKKIFDKIVSQAHLGLTDPEDLANAILFLASPLSKRITGQVISVNGGISVA